MKRVLFSLIGLMLSFNAHAVFLQYCSNYSMPNNPVSFSFSSCVNSNFNSIDRELEAPTFFSYCSNFGSQVDYFFVSCINSNFRTAEQALREKNIFLQHCSNFRNDELDFFFVSCVNNNFREVERALSRP